jgi:hypothetical protein
MLRVQDPKAEDGVSVYTTSTSPASSWATPARGSSSAANASRRPPSSWIRWFSVKRGPPPARDVQIEIIFNGDYNSGSLLADSQGMC